MPEGGWFELNVAPLNSNSSRGEARDQSEVRRSIGAHSSGESCRLYSCFSRANCSPTSCSARALGSRCTWMGGRIGCATDGYCKFSQARWRTIRSTGFLPFLAGVGRETEELCQDAPANHWRQWSLRRTLPTRCELWPALATRSFVVITTTPPQWFEVSTFPTARSVELYKIYLTLHRHGGGSQRGRRTLRVPGSHLRDCVPCQ